MLHYVLLFVFYIIILYYYIIMLLYYYFRKSFDTLSWLYDLFREHSFTKSYGCTICSGNIPSQRPMVVRFVPGTFLQKELWHARMVVRFVPGTFLQKELWHALMVARFVPGTFLHKELWLYDLFREHSFTKSYGCTFCSGNIPSERALARSHGCTICSGNIPSERAMVVQFVPVTFLPDRAMVVRFVPGTFLHKELWLYDLFREHSFRKSYGCTICSGNISSEKAV